MNLSIKYSRKINGLLPSGSTVHSVNFTKELTQKNVSSTIYPRLEVIYKYNNEMFRTFISSGHNETQAIRR